MSHFDFVKTVSLRELHANTGRVIRAAAKEGIIVTDHNRAIVLIKPFRASEMKAKPFPSRKTQIKAKRRIAVDSATAVGEIRGR